MRKVWTIACREYGAMVATKAFLATITLMPILMFGGIVVASRLKDVEETDDKVVVVADGSGALFADLEQAAAARNTRFVKSKSEISDSDESRLTVGAHYVLRQHSQQELDAGERLALSNQIRKGDIAAFVEIPADVMSDDTNTIAKTKIRFHAQNALLSGERRWLEQTINNTLRSKRLSALQIDPEEVRKASTPVAVLPLGLFKKNSAGEVEGAGENRNLVGIFLPFGVMMLMFMVIFLSAQPMLESVLEEKADRIAEVLLGSASPFQLMLGKLLGNVAGSLSVVAIYAAGACAVAVYNDWTDMIPFDVVPWFLAFQVLAVLLYSSVFMAVGAAVTQLKEAQSMLLPVWLVLSCPMFVWLQVIREPNGALATGLSFFPPATPMLMVVRLASESVIPIWQPICGLVILVAATLLCIFLAGRVFRIGILWQGKTPKVNEILRWALRG